MAEEFEACGFEETVFEVIQIPHNRPLVEADSRITYREIHIFSTCELDVGQSSNGFGQQFLFGRRERPGEPAFLDFLEKQGVAEIGLDICHTVVAYSEDFRNRYALFAEMPGHVDESFVFGNRCAENANDRI